MMADLPVLAGSLFFCYETDLPPGVGFDPFSPPHLLWVGLSMLTTVLILIIGSRLTIGRRKSLERVLSVVLGLTYVLRWIWAAVIGHFRLQEMLPLHLCAVAAIFEIAAVFTVRPLFREFGYACGIPGAIIVFLTPGIGPYPLLHFYYLLFIIDHTILFLLPLLWVTAGGFKPDWRRLPRVFALVLAAAALAVGVNSLISSNYMFLSFVPDNTFWTKAAAWFGIPGYQAAMAGLLLVVWVIMYLPWAVRSPKTPRTSR